MSQENDAQSARIKSIGQLGAAEVFWRDRQQWLQERGYSLRARYSPDWKPSWEDTKKEFYDCEDALPLRHASVMDATRTTDAAMVTLKKVSKSVHPYEAELGNFFSSDPLRSHPMNHCVPIYEVMEDPLDDDIVILVMPLLRDYNDPPFKTVGEAVDFFHQIFVGLQFMHSKQVAHRDCMTLNIMMDPRPLYPEMYHPVRTDRKWTFTAYAKPSEAAKHYTRTERPTKYFLTDFGLSRKYNSEDGPARELPILGGDKSAPEFQGEGYDQPADPFATDVYYIGNVVREDFLQRYRGLEFMNALIADMVQADPQKRPTMTEAVSRLEEILHKLSWWTLRSRLVKRKDHPASRIFKGLAHAYRTAGYVARGLPAVPAAS